MKCDDFLSAHESTSLWRRWQAARHVRQCAACTETARIAAELARDLRPVEPITPRQRALWAQTAQRVSVVERSSTTGTQERGSVSGGGWLGSSAASPQKSAGAVALAAVLLLAATATIVGWRQAGPRADQPRITKSDVESAPQPPTAITRTLDPTGELNELLASVDALAADLAQARRKAELLDARREAETMIATYNLW